MAGVAHFFDSQIDHQRDVYVRLLQVTGSLSNLFADSKDPFLYYRAMENIFCKAFEAHSFARSDVSADAGKGRRGIGLKTFLQNNGKTFQKVAEFNKESGNFRDLSDGELIELVANARNERIRLTQRTCELDEMIYHVITRSRGRMAIYEEPMDLVDVGNIRIRSRRSTTVQFTDGIHDYSFNKSKSTLFKRFMTPTEGSLRDFTVDILEDPYDFLLGLDLKSGQDLEFFDDEPETETIDYIVLPLYQTRGKDKGEVAERSGLNQWAAQGRLRNPNEVYIPIPLWIHGAKPGFFVYNTEDRKTAPFDVTLPSGKILSMKVAQQGGKALMSNPNSAVGQWLLRDVLDLPELKPVTRFLLDSVAVDSVKLSKLADGSYALDVLKPGSYEAFESEYLEN